MFGVRDGIKGPKGRVGPGGFRAMDVHVARGDRCGCSDPINVPAVDAKHVCRMD